MKKIKLRSRKKMKPSTKITIIIILIIVFIYLFLNYCGKKVFPIIMQQAQIDCKKMAISIIKNSLNDDVLNTLDEDELFYIVKNNNGEVQTIDFNPVVVNKFLRETTSVVSENLKKIEKGDISNLSFLDMEDFDVKKLRNGVISEIPMGIISNNVLLSNLGPKIPVKINLVGNVVSSIETSTSNYGINNAIIEIYAKVEVTEEVIIPFRTDRIKVTNNIPIAIKVVQGTVPNYYSGGKLDSSSNILSLPIETNQ